MIDIRFEQQYGIHFPGEVAGFADDRAEEIVRTGAAAYVEQVTADDAAIQDVAQPRVVAEVDPQQRRKR